MKLSMQNLQIWFILSLDDLYNSSACFYTIMEIEQIPLNSLHELIVFIYLFIF